MKKYKVYVSFRERYEVEVEAKDRKQAEDIAVNNTKVNLISIGDFDDGLWVDEVDELD